MHLFDVDATVLRRQRHRRRRAAARGRAGPRRPDARRERCHRLLLRRRRRRRGRVPRVPQPGRAVAAAGPVLLREQPLRHGHRAAPRPRRDRPGAAGGVVRHVAWAVDGMDVVAVEDATRRAVERIRAGGGPASWSCAPTASARTRCTTPSATATRPRSSGGRSATRSSCSRPGCGPTGELDDDARPPMEARSPPRSTAAVAAAEAGTAGAGRGPDPVRLLAGALVTRHLAGPPSPRGHDDVPRGDAGRAPRGAAARRAGVPDGRGRRALRRLLRGQPGPARGVRSRADPRHARCRSRPSSVPGSARRSAGCGRSSRS